MFLNLEPYRPREGIEPLSVDVDQDMKVSDLIILYRHLQKLPSTLKLYVVNDESKPLKKRQTLRQLRIANGETLRVALEGEIYPAKKHLDRFWILCSVLACSIVITCILLYFIFRERPKALIEQSALFGDRLIPGRCDFTKYFDSARKHGVIVDGGEMNTCVVSYSWIEGNTDGGCLRDEKECCIKNDKANFSEGGLSSGMAENLMKRVMVCVKNVTDGIEDKQRISTHVAATASSIDLMTSMGRDRINASLERLKTNLQKAQFPEVDAFVLSGEQKAFYGWIADSYLNYAFQPWARRAKELNAYGYMDLGDISTEISFSTIESEETQSIKLFGKKYSVLSKRYPCFGRNAAKERHQSLLIKDINETVIEDPCLQKHGIEKKKVSELLLKQCSHSNRFNGSPTTLRDIMKKEYIFLGTGDPHQCRQMISKILSEEECNKYEFSECFHKVKVPKNTKFLAHSIFFSVMNSINLQPISLMKFSELVNEICHRNSDSMMEIPEEERLSLCFSTQYIYELLVTGYGFTDELWDDIKFVGNEMNNEDMTWTLGYIISKTKIGSE